MNTQSEITRSGEVRATLGLRRGSVGRRIVLHHVPVAIASAVLFILFISLPPFVDSDNRGDISSGVLPRAQTGETIPGGMVHGGEEQAPASGHGDSQGATGHGGNRGRSGSHGSDADQTGGGHTAAGTPGKRDLSQRLAIASGYVGLILIGLTLLIGPANLLLRRRNPISSYLRRDLGTWAVVSTVAHVVLGVISYDMSFLDFFVDNGTELRTSSFGWGNWAGLGALVVMTTLLTLSTDRSLRDLRAGPWKRLQRLNYALFALVVLHAFFYGALLRVASPFTMVLIVSVAVVLGGQLLGIWLWRRRQRRQVSAA